MQRWKGIIQFLSFPLFKEVFHWNRFNSLKHLKCFCVQVALLLSTLAINICITCIKSSSLWKNVALLGHAKHFGRTFSGEEGAEGKRSKLLLSSLPLCQEMLPLSTCQSWLKCQEQVEIQVFSFHFQGTTKGYTTAISGTTERLLSALVIKERRDGLSF